MTRSTKFALRLLLSAFAIVAVASPLTAKTAKAKLLTCNVVYKKKYLAGRMHKAIATNGARSPYAWNTDCGWGEGYPTKKQAISRALRECRMQSKKDHISLPCKVYQAK
jgi:hypothetical protein